MRDITIFNETKSIPEWISDKRCADGLDYWTFVDRLKRMAPEKALTKPLNYKKVIKRREELGKIIAGFSARGTKRNERVLRSAAKPIIPKTRGPNLIYEDERFIAFIAARKIYLYDKGADELWLFRGGWSKC